MLLNLHTGDLDQGLRDLLAGLPRVDDQRWPLGVDCRWYCAA